MNIFLKTLGVAGVAFFPVSALADWTGPYGGLALGTSTQGDLSFDESRLGEDETDAEFVFGAFAGYQHQTGSLVYGGEFEFTRAPSAELSNDSDVQLDASFVDIKGRLGYAFGNALFYGTAGLSRISIDSDNGDFSGRGASFGVGFDYLMREHVILGAEYLMRRTDGEDEWGNDFELNTDTLVLRAAYKF